MPIRKLPPLLVNQIAAGEVIERPASVVKELVENSLDAGATRIDVTVDDGGRELIRIADDGNGIPADELPLALAAHATSKLHSAEQLAAIDTLGFRGEALASIASVSRMRITTRARDEQGQLAEAAATIEASGDQLSDPAPAAGAPGTTIEIRDLFFNTPARRKFLRTASTEFGHINELIQRLAMVHHAVAFSLTHNGRKSLDLSAERERARRCVAVLGKDLEEGLLAFEHVDTPERGGMQVWGLAGMPSLARATGKFQYLCVNGRPVRDRQLTHAVREAYRGLVPPDRHPVAVVFVHMDPAEVDVNVHPAKAEVRFRNPSAVHGLVLAAIRQRLLAADLTPSARMAERSSPFNLRPSAEPSQPSLLDTPTQDQTLPQTDAPSFSRGPWPARSPTDISSPTPAGQPTDRPQPHPSGAGGLSSDEFVNYFRRMDPTQKGFVYQQVKQALAEESPNAFANDADDANDASPKPQASSLKPINILQVHESYVVTQDDEGLLIVDQHALHERVMFEQLRQRVLGEGRILESQRMLMPAVLRASAKRQALLEELGPLLARIGVEVEPMGSNAVGVQAFPSFLFDRGVEPIEFLDELLDKAEEGEIEVSGATVDEGVLHEVLDMMACKAAVKAGDRMSEAELESLLQQRDRIERSSNCPHGRPTTLRLSLRDLAKQFGRSG
ncbi:DNA mismatch repair endonuclease MutL [Phycisphaerales bacterium AB-hyl4]|uniref:DNA mismatch repair protein MutL n=1 Tax=Natronomicrosphaera hydrolytica TaxID=3242702 RepID=A0ABV4U5U1_9BACT